MARSLLHTFADSKHFEDRRGKAYAQPITERINVKYTLIFTSDFPPYAVSHYHSLIHDRLCLTTSLKEWESTIMEYVFFSPSKSLVWLLIFVCSVGKASNETT